MKKLLFLLLSGIVFISFSSFAVTGDWEVFTKNDNVTMYFQPKSIKGKVMKTVTVLVNFKKARTGQNGKEIRSVRMIQNYDCAGRRVRLESAINFAGNNLRGTEVSKGNEITSWQRIPRNVPYEKLLERVCAK